jgi:hypothetical protein
MPRPPNLANNRLSGYIASYAPFTENRCAGLEKVDNWRNYDMILIRVIKLNSFNAGAVFRGRWAAQFFLKKT